MEFSKEAQYEIMENAKRVLQDESQAIQNLIDNIDISFVNACKEIMKCTGRIIVTGMGKSGHIAQKIAASLTSTGIASHFLHPAEGFHGDLGVVHCKDLLLAISYSGETKEILDIVPLVQHIGVPVIAITSARESSLARNADIALLLGDHKEADKYNLVPTTSTTLSLVMGDALTIALMELRNFTPKDFAIFHPSGMLGKRLTLKISSLLQGEKTNPVVNENELFSKSLQVITAYTLGGTSVVNDENVLVGIVTDGDVRRILEKFALEDKSMADIMKMKVSQLMTRNPEFVYSDTLAYNALERMEQHKPRPIFVLPVVDINQRPIGMLHLHTLVQAGFKTSQVKNDN